MSSDDLTDEDKDTAQTEQTVTVKRQETVYKGHWKDKRDIRICNGCQKSLNKIQSRHHCRICGEVYCFRCTRFSRRLLPDRIPDPQGKKYKVCRFCNADVFEESNDGKTRSWTNEFHEMNLEFRNMKREAVLSKSTVSLDKLDDEETDNRGILRVRSVRGQLINVFNDDLRKPTSDKIMEKGKKAAKKGGLHRIFKRKKHDPETKEPLIKICEDCKTNLSIDGIKRGCAVCGLNFCDTCCGKDVVISYQLGESPDIYDPEIIIDGTDLEELEQNKLKKFKRYRVCRFCRSQYQNECFLREVSNLTHILIQIQREIKSIEEEEENEQELSTLQNEYMQYYRKVGTLQTNNSPTQERLKNNVRNAMREFYIHHVSRDSFRLSQRNLSCVMETAETEDAHRSINVVTRVRRSIKKVRNRLSRRENSRSSMNDLSNSTSQLSLDNEDNYTQRFVDSEQSDLPTMSQSSLDEPSTSHFGETQVPSQGELPSYKCNVTNHQNAEVYQKEWLSHSEARGGSCTDINSSDAISQISLDGSIDSKEGSRHSKPRWLRAVNRKLRKFRSVSELFTSKSQTDLRSSESFDQSHRTTSVADDLSVGASVSTDVCADRENDGIVCTSNNSEKRVNIKKVIDLQDDDVIMCDDYSGITKNVHPSRFSRVKRFRKSCRNAARRLSEKGSRLRDLKILSRNSDTVHKSGRGDIIMYRTESLHDISLYTMATLQGI